MLKARYILPFAFLAVFFLCSWTDWGYAEENAELQKKVDQIQSEVVKLKEKDDELEFLKEQMEDFKESAKSEVANHREFVEGEWNKFMGLLTVVGAVLVFVLGASFFEMRREIKNIKTEALNDFRDNIKKELEDMKNEIEMKQNEVKKMHNELENEIEKIQVKLKQQLQDDIVQKLTPIMKNMVEEEIVALKSVIDQEQRYRKAKILITGSSNHLKEMKKDINRAMEMRGLQEPTYYKLPKNLEDEHLKALEEKLEGIDILVYCYIPDKKTEENGKEIDYDCRLTKIINLLNDGLYEIPFIVYTYHSGKRIIEQSDLNHYLWSFPANTPSTLMGHIFTNIHAMINHKEVE